MPNSFASSSSFSPARCLLRISRAFCGLSFTLVMPRLASDPFNRTYTVCDMCATASGSSAVKTSAEQAITILKTLSKEPFVYKSAPVGRWRKFERGAEAPAGTYDQNVFYLFVVRAFRSAGEASLKARTTYK
jgi:hypothetical protein